MKRALKILAITALCLLAVAALAYASEGGHGGEHPLPWKNFMWRLINFAVFVGFIWKFAGKKIADFFGGRRYQIENELNDLDTRKKDAEAKLRDVEKSIANIEQERAALLAEYRAQGEALKQAIIEKAEESAVTIRTQAASSAALEAKVAVDQMRAQVAEMVVEAAQQILQKKLTKEDHEKLVDDYITKVVLH